MNKALISAVISLIIGYTFSSFAGDKFILNLCYNDYLEYLSPTDDAYEWADPPPGVDKSLLEIPSKTLPYVPPSPTSPIDKRKSATPTKRPAPEDDKSSSEQPKQKRQKVSSNKKVDRQPLAPNNDLKRCPCSGCQSEVLFDIDSLYVHIDKTHLKQITKQNKDGFFHCIAMDCNEKYLRKATLNHHVLSHSGKDPSTECSVCYRRFKNAGPVRQHNIITHGVSSVPDEENYDDSVPDEENSDDEDL